MKNIDLSIVERYNNGQKQLRGEIDYFLKVSIAHLEEDLKRFKRKTSSTAAYVQLNGHHQKALVLWDALMEGNPLELDYFVELNKYNLSKIKEMKRVVAGIVILTAVSIALPIVKNFL